MDEPIRGVLVRIGPVPRHPAGRALEAGASRRGGGGGPLHERTGRIAPADGVDRGSADDADRDGPTGRRETAGVGPIGHSREDARSIGQQQSAAGLEEGRCGPDHFARHGRAGGRRVDDLETEQVDRPDALVCDLDEFVGRGRAACLHLRDHQGRRWPGDGGRHR